jgi:hypothetical protein
VIRWAYAFIDRPFGGYERALEFWSAVTGTVVSPRRGDLGQFATLLPANGDACVKVQAVGDEGGAHIDLCVEDVVAEARRASGLGATEVFAEPGLVVMRSPGGQAFCLVQWQGESVHTAETWAVCVPGEHDFWPLLSGLPVQVRPVDDIDRACVAIECPDIGGTRRLHESHGATFVARRGSWTTMRDPAGGTYRLSSAVADSR